MPLMNMRKYDDKKLNGSEINKPGDSSKKLC